MPIPEIPTEVLQRIFRAFCERRFDYLPENYGSERVRQERIDRDAAVYYAHPDSHLLRLVTDVWREAWQDCVSSYEQEIHRLLERSEGSDVIAAKSVRQIGAVKP